MPLEENASYFQLPDEDQIKSIYDEFATNEEKTAKKVQELIKWLEREPHLPNVKNEFFLRNYLLRCKNDFERAQKTIERYYITKAKMPDVFTGRNIHSEDFKKCFDLGTFVPLPKLTPEGYRVCIYKVNGRLDSKMPSSTEYVKNSQTMGLIDMKSDLHKKSIVICDFNDVSLSFIALMLCSLRRLLSLNTKVIPFRFHKIYLMNAIPALSPLITLAKTFAKKEIGDRIEIWKKPACDFVKVVPADILPSDYGGTERPFEELADLWLTEIKRHQSWFDEEEKDVANLNAKKRNSKIVKSLPDDAQLTSPAKTADEICFRELNLD